MKMKSIYVVAAMVTTLTGATIAAAAHPDMPGNAMGGNSMAASMHAMDVAKPKQWDSETDAAKRREEMMRGGETMQCNGMMQANGMTHDGMMNMMGMMDHCGGTMGPGAMIRLPKGHEKLQLQMQAEIMQKTGEILAKYAARLPDHTRAP